MTAIRFLTCPVSAALSGAVRELWLLDDEGDFHAGLPKPYVELVVSLSGIHWWRASPDAREHRYHDSWVTPVQDGPRYARADGRRYLIGARLEPWAAHAMWGRLPRGDGSPPPLLSALIGEEAQSLRAWLVEARDDVERFARFTAWLEKQEKLTRFIGYAVDVEACGASAAALAGAMGVAPRSLRRRFASDFGLSPKQWLKLHRLDAVLRDTNLFDIHQSLALMAQEHGYSDQAHFSREVSGLTGVTPGALRGRQDGLPPHLMPGE